MNQLIFTAFILSALLGAGHGADLLWGIDTATGLCTAGSVWWRYLALGAVLLVAVLAGRKNGIQPQTVLRRQNAAAVLAFAGAFCLAAAGAATLLAGATALQLVEIVLDLLCAVWFVFLGRCWLGQVPGKTPTATLIPAVLGSGVFYWNVLMCFMENSSSWHRVQPTTEVWQQLAAVLFLAALIRAQYQPLRDTYRDLGATAMAAFVLCLCWQLPETVYTLLSGPWTLSALADLFGGLGLCCIGGIAGVFAAEAAKKNGKKSEE